MEDLHGFIPRYEKSKERFKVDQRFNETNKALALRYLEDKEQEFKDIYGVSHDAQVRNTKTLYKHLRSYLLNILLWFNDKDLTQVTEKDILEVYRGVEEGRLKGRDGKKLSDRTLKDIYGRHLKSGFFQWLGKSDISKRVIKRRVLDNKEVRFFDFGTLKQIVSLSQTKHQRLGFLLLYDLGLEAMAVCQLKKGDFELKYDTDTRTNYYQCHISKDISKRGRQTRTNAVMFKETNEALNSILPRLRPEDKVLGGLTPNGLYRALQVLNKDKVFRVKPNGQPVNIKDFRSSCATYFLSIGWSTDEVKGRLGHSPSSDEIDRYVNYLGLNQRLKRKQTLTIDFNNYQEELEKANQQIRKQHLQLEKMALFIGVFLKQSALQKLTPKEEAIFQDFEGSWGEILDTYENSTP